MNGNINSLEQVRAAGIKALSQKLGIVGMIRFLQQYESGTGDYTKERHDWLPREKATAIAQKIRLKKT